MAACPLLRYAKGLAAYAHAETGDREQWEGTVYLNVATTFDYLFGLRKAADAKMHELINAKLAPTIVGEVCACLLACSVSLMCLYVLG